MSLAPSINVFGKPLATCSTDPMTGFMRNGKCDTNAMDQGSHTLAGQVTPEFLSFSASRGNDLRSILSPGCRWCLCVSRWKEALDAYRAGEVSKAAVPGVLLDATHKIALEKVTLKDLQEFSVDPKHRSEL
ncbi:unnamed protein product [Parajaminaea phylloscopi]